MARSGVDEFYEILRLILAKFFAESAGLSALPDVATCNRLLFARSREVAGILDDAVNIQTPADLFKDIQVLFTDVSIRGQDFTALDDAFEVLTSRTYKADKGQYFTPRHVVDMCVNALDPRPHEVVCDPACGSGAFLKAAYSYGLRNYGGSPGLRGFDYSHRATQVARAVSLVGTEGTLRVEQVDSLKFRSAGPNEPTIESMMGRDFHGFDVILTNPPFAGDVSQEQFAGDYELATSVNRKLERDVLFMERCLRLLKVGGRMAIVLPDNKVSSRAFRDFRLFVARNSEINAVVSLHRYTFLPYTSQKASVLFVTRKEKSFSPYNTAINFYRSDKAGKTSNGSPVYRDPERVDRPPYEALDHDLEEVAEDIRRHTCVG